MKAKKLSLAERKLSAHRAAHYAANREREVARAKRRYQTDPQFRLRACLRNRINVAVKRRMVWKITHTRTRFFGCRAVELRTYLEKQFSPWMSWENYGPRGWHVDHIKPLSAFDLTDPKQAAKACHYTNLRPLHWRENVAQVGNRKIKR